ncbi:MAG: hypothetical protein L0Z53_15090 [Acidobacteriales bacterium]|nr:hypothetical protein [Terriglobales bacterium]
MATPVYQTTDSDSTLPTYPLSHTTPNGRVFHATVTVITQSGLEDYGCYVMAGDFFSGERQYGSMRALQNDWARMKAWLNTYNQPEAAASVAVVEDVKTAAVDAPAVEQVIRLDAAEAPISQPIAATADAAPEALADAPSAPSSAEISEKGVTPPAERLRLLNSLRRRAFVYPFKGGTKGFAKVRQWLNREIARYESQQIAKSHATMVEGEYYFKTDLSLALLKFAQKHGRKPTQIFLSKYDHVPVSVDVAGIEVVRAAKVLPGDIYLCAPKQAAPMRPPRGTVGLSTTAEAK